MSWTTLEALVDLVADPTLSAQRRQLIVGDGSNAGVVASAWIGDRATLIIRGALPWTVLVMLAYYPLVLLIDAKRDRDACNAFRQRNAWLVHVWAAWNLLLSVLSGIGVWYATFGILLSYARTTRSSTDWFCSCDGYGALYASETMLIFVASKFFELLDTAFLLALSAQPVAFLHSFHHVFTLFYVFYAAMNYETLNGHSNAIFGW